MKIAFVFSDEQLKEHFISRKPNHEDELYFYPSPEELLDSAAQAAWDAVVVSDRYFELPDWCEFIETAREVGIDSKRMIAMLSNRHNAVVNDSFVKHCTAGGIACIPAGRAADSVVLGVYAVIYGGHADAKRHSRCIVFVGSTPNIGTTVVSFGTALELAKRTNGRIGYLCLNLKSSKVHRYLGFDDPAASLDQIRAELKSQTLAKERLYQYSTPLYDQPNLRILFGNMLREQAEFFTPEDIEFLLRTAGEAFDLCVVEVNAYWDNAATICSLLHADSRILVTTKQIASFQEDISRWTKNLAGVFGIAPDTFDLFVTQFGDGSGTGPILRKDIRKETNMQIIGSMKKYDYIADYLCRGKLAQLFAEHSEVSADLAGLVRALAALYNLPRPEAICTPWFKRLLSGFHAT